MKKRYILFFAILAVLVFFSKASAQTTPTNPGGVRICSTNYDCGRDDNICPEDFGATCNICDPDCSYTIDGNTVTTASFCVGRTKGGTECNPYCQQIAPEATALSIDTMISRTIPTRDQRDVNLIGEINIYFNRLMDTSPELIQDSMAVLTTNGQPISTTKGWISADPETILIISTRSPLEPSTTYTVTLDGQKFLTSSREAIQGTYTFSFTTRSAPQQQPSCVNADNDGASRDGGGTCCPGGNCHNRADCKDDDPNISPANSEENQCNDLKDNDCDTATDCMDTDCRRSNNPSIGPGGAQCCTVSRDCRALNFGCDTRTFTCVDSVQLSNLNPSCCMNYEACYNSIGRQLGCPPPNTDISTKTASEIEALFRGCPCSVNSWTVRPECAG